MLLFARFGLFGDSLGVDSSPIVMVGRVTILREKA